MVVGGEASGGAGRRQWWWSGALSEGAPVGRLLLLWVPVVGPWLAVRTLLTGPEPQRRRRGEGFAFFRVFR